MITMQILADSILFGATLLIVISFLLLLKTKEFKELYSTIKNSLKDKEVK